ncbi:putative Enoyl reductase (ER) domain-containing protein [Seiridium unicorne]|uniref:Enoyl reductase (ER) domain-containing protein n=1 Tax=Seiridium unicorne TaxID=138068 RepID=A0ABR2VGN8_9PEZI
MKAVVIEHFVRSYGDVRVSDIPIPQPNGQEILIQVKAAGVNFVDTLYCRGLHQNNRRHVKPPFTLGLEFAGVVVSAPSTCRFAQGSRVFGTWTGAYTEFLAIPLSLINNLHPIPSSWTFAEAASLGATLPVSYGALVLRGALQSGETVLVHSAAGGLGLAAVQLAHALGCRVIGTAGSDLKCSIAEKYGAEKCINYSADPSWWGEVKRLTGEQGVDLVFDSVGLVSSSLRCLAHRGRVLVVGFAGREGDMEQVKMNRVLLGHTTIIGYRFGESDRRDPTEAARIWGKLLPLIEADKIKPTIYDATYPGLESVPQALEDISSRRVWGKAVIRLEGTEAKVLKANL